MKNFRPDKKLKRKRNWRKWRKVRNILENWIREESNRRKIGLSGRKPSIQFTQRKKYPREIISQAQIYKLMKESREKATKQKQEAVLKLKWYQKLWLKILNLLKKIRKK